MMQPREKVLRNRDEMTIPGQQSDPDRAVAELACIIGYQPAEKHERCLTHSTLCSQQFPTLDVNCPTRALGRDMLPLSDTVTTQAGDLS